MSNNALSLIEKAQKSKLTTDERRVCVAHYMQTDPARSNYDLADEFQVSETAIRNDKKEIRESINEELRSADIGLVVVDAFMCIARQVKDLERSKKSLETKEGLGSKEYIQHCTSLVDTQLKFVKMQQDLGYLPKNLGQMQLKTFEYAAVLQEDGSVESRPVNMFDADTQKKISESKERNKPTMDLIPAAIVASEERGEL